MVLLVIYIMSSNKEKTQCPFSQFIKTTFFYFLGQRFGISLFKSNNYGEKLKKLYYICNIFKYRNLRFSIEVYLETSSKGVWFHLGVYVDYRQSYILLRIFKLKFKSRMRVRGKLRLLIIWMVAMIMPLVLINELPNNE